MHHDTSDTRDMSVTQRALNVTQRALDVAQCACGSAARAHRVRLVLFQQLRHALHHLQRELLLEGVQVLLSMNELLGE